MGPQGRREILPHQVSAQHLFLKLRFTLCLETRAPFWHSPSPSSGKVAPGSRSLRLTLIARTFASDLHPTSPVWATSKSALRRLCVNPKCCLLFTCCRYGGGIWHTWLDRDLSVAGRIVVTDNGSSKFTSKLVKIDKPIIRIPSLAIHCVYTNSLA